MATNAECETLYQSMLYAKMEEVRSLAQRSTYPPTLMLLEMEFEHLRLTLQEDIQKRKRLRDAGLI